jgi:hypothetical protein
MHGGPARTDNNRRPDLRLLWAEIGRGILPSRQGDVDTNIQQPKQSLDIWEAYNKECNDAIGVSNRLDVISQGDLPRK